MNDLPEPFVAVIDKSTAGHESWESLSYYTAQQMREYRNAALEEAAKVCEGRIGGAVQSNEWWNGFKSAMKQCGAAIRSLKGTK